MAEPSRKRKLDSDVDQISNKILKMCLKREREDEQPESSNKRQMLQSELNEARVELITLKDENRHMRNEMDQKDKLISYGCSEIKKLNAKILTLKHQVSMMEDYVACMEGRENKNSDVIAY